MVDGTISVVVTININNGWPASEGQGGDLLRSVPHIKDDVKIN